MMQTEDLAPLASLHGLAGLSKFSETCDAEQEVEDTIQKISELGGYAALALAVAGLTTGLLLT